jgi:membrane-bound lytic murein transglycosylase D
VTNDRQRRAVRACSVDVDCHSTRELMLEFEREAFPKSATQSPWIDGDDAMGHDSIVTRPKPTVENEPTALRPDLEWLADLEMPDLPVHWDHRIIRYLEFYKEDPRGRNIMRAWLRDQGKFEDLILEHLRREGLPEDLLYVAMIESSYDAFEYSRSGASGLWQFMPGAGRIYGMEIDRWVDERNDPLRSTEGAVLYMKDLYQRYGDWDLALAAYNAGYGNVTRSIAKYNTNDFWQLLEYEAGLPWGSRIYVPKALAAAIVGHNRKLFGFDKIKQTAKYEYDTVTVPTSVSFAVIARAAGADKTTIERLNPHLRRGRTPPKVKDFVVRIPKGRAELFAERFPQLRGDWDKYDAYVTRHGERFEDIATVHGLSRKQLAELNDVSDTAEVTGGITLVVPRLTDEDKRKNKETADADLYRASVPRGGPDDPLIVAVPDKSFRIEGKKRFFYRVVSGDSQWAIAKAFGVDQKELAEWNGLDAKAHLQARMVLQAWATPKFSPEKHNIAVLDETRMHIVESGSLEHIELSEGRLGRRRTTYTVKSGGTFADVGKKYGLSKYDLARINRKSPNTTLKKGDEVLVYEVVDPTKSKRAQRQDERRRRGGKKKKRKKRRK